ncbi:MAG: hypothetical protein OQK73_10460 [Gammaproteobacteria bacterium]|nr:hypothetical protein [Gammaproteobacteria bacterium]
MKNICHFLLLFSAGFALTACTSSPSVIEENRPESRATYIPSTDQNMLALDPVTQADNTQIARPVLSGKWVLNKELSDSLQDKIKESMQQAGNTRGDKSMRGGHGGQGGGRGGMNKERSKDKNKANSNRKKSMPQSLLALLTTSEMLELKHDEPVLTIITNDSNKQRIYTDFRGASISVSGGASQKVVTGGWERNVLVVETTVESGSFIQRYKLHPESRQLWVNALILSPSLPKPVQVNRVYELNETKTKEVCIKQNGCN